MNYEDRQITDRFKTLCTAHWSDEAGNIPVGIQRYKHSDAAQNSVENIHNISPDNF